MSELRPDPEVIRATYRWLAHADHGVSEVRVIRPGKGIVGIGFFDDDHVPSCQVGRFMREAGEVPNV